MFSISACISNSPEKPTLLSANAPQGISQQVVLEPPQWFIKRSIRPVNATTIIGYGSGSTLLLAQNRARSEVALSLKADINVSFTCRSVLENGDFNENCQEQMKSSSGVNLTSSSIIKSSQLGKQFFVAIEYDNAPVDVLALRRLGQFNCQSQSRFSVWQNTFFSRQLSHQLGCVPNWTLNYQHTQWHVVIDNHVISLKNRELSNFWIKQKDNKITLYLPINVKHDSGFVIDYHVHTSGYFSLINVSHKGQAQVLIENQHLLSGSKGSFPAAQNNNEIVSLVNENEPSTQDLYVAVLCQQPLPLGQFKIIEGAVINEEDHNLFSYGKLLDVIEGCALSSLIQTTTL